MSSLMHCCTTVMFEDLARVKCIKFNLHFAKINNLKTAINEFLSNSSDTNSKKSMPFLKYSFCCLTKQQF